ncbi:hypothetical protein PQX77_002128, partial [Marasmius sp. AFHP31]
MQAQVNRTEQAVSAARSVAVVQTLLRAGLGCITFMRYDVPFRNLTNSTLIVSDIGGFHLKTTFAESKRLQLGGLCIKKSTDGPFAGHFTTAEDGRSYSSNSSFSTPDWRTRNINGLKIMNMCRGYTDEADRILNHLEYGMFGEKGQGSDTQRCGEERKSEARDVGLTDLVEQSHHLDDVHGRPP